MAKRSTFIGCAVGGHCPPGKGGGHMDWPDQKMLLGGGHKQRKRNPGQNSPLRSQWRGHMNEREVVGDWHSSISAIGRISHQ